jgi:hypothetical protein
MGKRSRNGKHSPQKNNSIQDSVGNEENGYTVPDSNKTMINVIKKPSDTHRKSLKEESSKKFIKKRLYKMHSKNFKTQKVKNMRRHRNK